MTARRRPTRRELLRSVAGACVVLVAACSRPRRRTATSGTPGGPAAGGTGSRAGSVSPTTPPPATASATPTVATSGSPRTAAAASHTASPLHPGPPAAFVDHGPGNRAEVALTFHGAGEPALAEQLMTIAERAGAHLTVFAVGQWLAQHPAMAGRITGGGHELANHTWSHPSLGRLGALEVTREITRCRDEIAKHAGAAGTYFRPSAMRVPSALVLKAAGEGGYRTAIGFDVDTLDFRNPGPAAVRRVATTARAGSIVSLHFGHPGTVEALPGILADLRRRGLKPVTVSVLLRP